MALIVVTEGENALLDTILDSFSAGLTLRLVTDQVALTNASVYADVTGDEATFGGYSAISLDDTDFEAVAQDGSNKAFTITTSWQTFTCDGTGANEVIRYYAITTGTTLLWYEQLPSDQTMEDNGDLISIKPRLTLCTESGN